jgi:hypothetical protein
MTTLLTEQDPVVRAVQANRDACNKLRGSLFGLVESWGLPERQEVAVKRLVRQQTYASQAEIESLLRGLQEQG